MGRGYREQYSPVQTLGQQRSNPLDYRWAMKALLVAMDRWTSAGIEPPPSRYPMIRDATLVALDRLRFPLLVGVNTSTAVHRAYRVDCGPRFAGEGVVTLEPPGVGSAFAIWRGNLIAGALGGMQLTRVQFDRQGLVTRREAMLTELRQRIRDVRLGPDGLIFATTDMAEGAVLKLEPVIEPVDPRFGRIC